MIKKIDLLRGFFYCSLLVLGFTACEEDDFIPAPEPVIPGSHGVFVLSEGSWGGNNAGVSYHNFETGNTTADILGGKLGDTGQDMIAYGSKLYISVNQSGYIKVVDLYSQAPIDSIGLNKDGKTLQPRYFTSYEGKIYVTTQSATEGNVVRIDTTNLRAEAIAQVGLFPEGIAAVNGKLYVANGGQGAGNTLSIVDIAQFKQENTIAVGLNPYIVRADKYGDLYLSYQGNFSDNIGGLQRIDTKTNTVTNITIPANRNFTIVDDLLYYFGITYNPDYSANCSFGVYNVKTETPTSDPVISDGTKISIAYGIGVNPLTKDVYISDTDYVSPGIISVFGPDGKKKETFRVGVSANNFVFN
ncbi:MAG: hypothetical protein LBO74_01135 [Candidatus Symbiothrix sp.]|jgi:hypothetical protein|nr:hypothetical protein [Candidatus Symbiothrix sp.]